MRSRRFFSSVVLSFALFFLVACSGSGQLTLGESTEDGAERSGASQPLSTRSDPKDSPAISGEPAIELFAASDVDEDIADAMETTLNVAADYWGLWWPVEYWVMGLDEAAGIELVEEFCSRRDSLAQWDYGDCMDWEASSEEHSMIRYQAFSAECFVPISACSDAAWSGEPEWGFHRFTQSYPFGLAGMMGISGDDDLAVVLHEYWHGVQHSHISTLDYNLREALMGPVWFVEGSAEYMGQYGWADLRSQGLLPMVPSGDYPYEFRGNMLDKLSYIDEAFSGECEGRELIELIEYSDPCTIAYDLGAWSIAYLLSQAGDDVLLEEFYPGLETSGWVGSFEQVAGITLEEFNADFMEFIRQSDKERMAILPVF